MEDISRAIVDGSLEDIAKREEAERLAAKRREDLVDRGAVVVGPYEPNRKQRRAQEARLRRK